MTSPSAGAYSPTANLNLTLTACTAAGEVLPSVVSCTANETGFFVNPLPADLNFVFGNFSATTTETTLTAFGHPLPYVLDISGGGGNITFATSVPEPVSLLLLGSSLIGLGMARRRRSRG